MKKLVKSSNKVWSGVLSGIAEYFNVDVSIIRILYILLTIFSFGICGLFTYLIMSLIIPEE